MARTSRKQNAVKPQPAIRPHLDLAALYLRLSKFDNGKKDSDSIENQELIIREYLKKKADIEIGKVFIENGHTGTVFDRPVFNEMMEDINAGKYNCVVVKDLSRFGRNSLEATDYVTNIFPEMDVRFISVRDDYDSKYDTEGKSQMYIMIDNFINELYSKDISKKSCVVLRSKRKQGLFIGGYAPYGYKKSESDKYVLEVDEEAAAVVRKIFEWRAEGQGYAEIYNRLNKMHIPSPTYYKYLKGIMSNHSKTGKAYPWSKHVVYDILRNETYVGNVVQGKQLASFYLNQELKPVSKDKWIIVENMHEAIISKELFAKVQEVNQSKYETYKQNENKHNLPRVENLYTGYLFCGDCGYAMKMVRSLSSKRDKAYYNFKCGNYYMHGKDYCTPKKIKKEDLDNAVLGAIRVNIALFADLKKELDILKKHPVVRLRTKEVQREIHELQLQEDKLMRLRAGLYEDYKEGLLTSDEFVEMRDIYTKQLDDVKLKIQYMESDNAFRKIDTRVDGTWEKVLQEWKNPQNITRELIETLIDKIMIYEDSRIKITFKCMDEFDKLRSAINKREEEVA
ncbi:MAG: recombinase family protein [Faecalimonas sp.]|nr:recombinase family protein [Faecalimonas sp.]